MSETPPITQEQEQELREWARRILAGEGASRAPDVPPFVASILGAGVLQGGRLSRTVSWEERYRIATEEYTTLNK